MEVVPDSGPNNAATPRRSKWQTEKYNFHNVLLFFVSIDAAAVDLVWRRGKSLVEGFFQFEPRGAI